MAHTGSQQQQSNPVQCIHQQCTFIYLMAESMMAQKEISAICSLGVVSHLFVGPQQLPQPQLSGSLDTFLKIDPLWTSGHSTQMKRKL